MYLKLEGFAGEHISDCCHAAVRIADMLTINTEFKFNDVLVLVAPGDIPLRVEEAFYEAMKSGLKLKIASVRLNRRERENT